WRGSGTQRGQFGPIPPTGRKVEYSGATFIRFNADGKIADVWSVNELFQVCQQLGVQMTPPAADAETAADRSAPVPGWCRVAPRSRPGEGPRWTQDAVANRTR